MRLPKGNNFTQNGNSDLLGDIWSSFNLDLANKNKKGKVLVSPRLLTNITSDDDADVGLPIAFRYVPNTGWFAICGNKIFQNGSSASPGMGVNGTRTPFTTFIEGEAAYSLPISDGFDINSDMEYFPDAFALVVSSKTKAYRSVSGGSFSEITGAGGGSGFVKKLCYFRKRSRMYMSYSGSKILSYPATLTPIATPSSNPNSTQYAMDLGGTNFITTILDGADYIWILTLNTGSNQSYQYLWDGSTAATPNDYAILESNGALCGIIKDNSLWIIDTEGRLMQNNGKAFVEKARFPFGGKLPKNSLLEIRTNSNPRWIHHNGMSIVDGKINILINNPFQDGSEESERCPAGVWEYDEEIGLYHKMSASYSPKATGAITDNGQVRLSAVGALMSSNHTSTDNGNILIGASYYSDATTVKSAIFTNDSQNLYKKYGSLVTQWIPTANIKEAWSKAYPRIRKFLNNDDRMIVKFRRNEDVASQITGTWTFTTTFTTPTDLRECVGCELEFLNGVGGIPVHINSVQYGTNWIITIDEAVTGATGTFTGRVQSWIKSGEFSNESETTPCFSLAGTENSPMIQIKLCFEWTGQNELFDILIENNKSQ